MNYLMRSLIAVPIIASLSVTGGISNAAIPSISSLESADTTLSLAGFLDFKTLIFSSGTGDNLDGVSDQIRIVGPELFRNAALRHGMLREFKSSPRPLLSTNPVWGGGTSDLDGLNVEVYGKPSAASADLIDAIIGDITDNYRNHGVSWKLNPAIGPGTATYFQTATQKVIGLIEKLENVVPTVPGTSDETFATQPVIKLQYLLLVFFFGLALVSIGLLLRRLRKTSPPPLRKADPAACFEAIGNSPIQYAAKTL